MKIQISQSNTFPAMSPEQMAKATKSRLGQLFAGAKGKQASSDANGRKVMTYTGTYESSIITKVKDICQQLVQAGIGEEVKVQNEIKYGIDPVMDAAAPDVSMQTYALNVGGKLAVAVQEYRFGSAVQACSYLVSVRL